MQIGIAGLGRMGAAMAARLIEVGHAVTVWNRSADKARALAEEGAAVAESPADLARKVEAVITILTDAAAIEAVYAGRSGLLSAELDCKLVIEMSTVRPDVEIALAERVRSRGADFVECPVSGTFVPARQGKLIGVMGAEPAAAARARPILEQLCRRVEHCGPVGAGTTMKFAINLPLMVYWQALGEALALCRPLGLDAQRLVELFAETSGGPNVLRNRGAVIARIIESGDGGMIAFDIDGGAKDLRAILAEGEARALELPLVERTLACYEEAMQEGLGQQDLAGISRYWSTRNSR